MFTAKGRVVNHENTPIKDAKISFEYQTNTLVNHTDGEGIFRFEINVGQKGVISTNIKVEAEGYKPYNRYTDLNIINNTILEIRLQKEGDIATPFPLPIKVALIGALATIISASIAVIYKIIEHSHSNQPSSPVSFTIRNSLGEYQKSETISVSLEGKTVGSLEVNELKPQDEIKVSLPHSGRYNYAAEGTTVFQNEKPILSSGSGEIDIAEGKNYEIKFSTDQNSYFVRLEEVH